MRGYFAIGLEGITKQHNLGVALRTAHAFGAAHVFAIAPEIDLKAARITDTSAAWGHLPLFEFPSVDALILPRGCQLVGIELTDDAIALPSFRHPVQAAYVFGPERGSLSPALQRRCIHLVQIPTRFSVNLGIAVALTCYDRQISQGRFAPRPVRAGGPTETPPTHVQGTPFARRALEAAWNTADETDTQPPPDPRNPTDP